MAQPPSPSLPRHHGAHTPSYTATAAGPTGHVQERGVAEDQGSLVDMLSRIDELEAIPRLTALPQASLLQTAAAGTSSDAAAHVVSIAPGVQSVEVGTSTQSTPPHPHSSHPHPSHPHPSTATPLDTKDQSSRHEQLVHNLINRTTEDLTLQLQTEVCVSSFASSEKRSKVGRPRVRPPRERQAWHYHLGGVRQCRVPLTPDLKEALEVAYVSRIMSKNFRKEGQPEKERIAQLTGLGLDKVQEWFKNRRKKDRLQKDRSQGNRLPQGRRGRRSTAETEAGQLVVGGEEVVSMETVGMETQGVGEPDPGGHRAYPLS